MKLSTRFISSKKQAGLTLIELISSLAIMALVIGGALSLYGSASSSQSTTQTTSELSALRSAIKGLYYGQGGYGATPGTSLNQVLISGNKVPSTITNPPATTTLTNSFGGDVLVASGATTANFTITVTNVPTATCLSLLSSANGWNSVMSGGTGTVAHTIAAATLPASPATAATDCVGTAGLNKMIFQSS